jgi:hypothetical protein
VNRVAAATRPWVSMDDHFLAEFRYEWSGDNYLWGAASAVRCTNGRAVSPDSAVRATIILLFLHWFFLGLLLSFFLFICNEVFFGSL